MKSIYRALNPPGRCEYLPGETWQLEYEEVEEITSAEYHERLKAGWRRFGHSLFRPQCPSCRACQSLRILAADFKPTAAQRRVGRKNRTTRLVRSSPTLDQDKLDLTFKYHKFQEAHKGWTEHERGDPYQYFATFLHNPFRTEEWQYYIDDRLAGVGYTDVLPDGLSAIYFYYDPDFRSLSPGTWNILSTIARARELELPYVYLGYYVRGSASMEYKAKFHPHEVLTATGTWERRDDPE